MPSNLLKAKFPKLMAFNAAFLSNRSDESIVTILMNGKGGDMKSFKETLSPAEMAAVAAYIRTFAKQ